MNTQQWMFSITLFFGASAIILFQIFGQNLSSNIFVPSLIVITIQLLYLYFVLKIDLINDHGVVDSFYYIGFLFTLVVMVMSFYQYNQTAVLNNANIAKLIAQNGIALSSTVVGMAIRLIVKMRDAIKPPAFNYPTQKEVDTYISLIIGLRRINVDLQNIAQVSELANTAAENTNIFAQSIESTNAKLEKLNQAIGILETGSSAAEIAARDALGNLLKSLNAAKYEVQTKNTNLRDEVNDLVFEIQTHLNTVSKQTTNIESLNARLLEFYALLNERVSRLLDQKND